MWAVSTLTMLVLAGILPDFRLRSADGSSATDIAVTAALGAGAFGLLSALVWPLLVRLLLLVRRSSSACWCSSSTAPCCGWRCASTPSSAARRRLRRPWWSPP